MAIYTYRAAHPQDAPELAAMYRAVAITKSNYREKLTPGPKDFSQIGGMFLIHDEDSLKNEMNSGHSLFGVLEDGSGKIAAMLWMCEEDPAFSSHSFTGRQIFAREIIAKPGLSSLLYYKVFTELGQAGYTCSAGEVYKLLEYSDAEGVHRRDMLNERSLKSIINTGAVLTGKNAVREVEVRSIPIKALIEPQIVHFDYDRVIPALERLLEGREAMR